MKKGKVLALLSLSVLTLGVVGGTIAHEGGFISGLEAGVVDQSSKDCRLTFTGNNLVNEGEKTYLLDGYTKLRVNGTVTKKGSQLIAEPGTIIYTDGTQYDSKTGTAGSVLNGLKQLDSVFVGEVNVYVGYSSVSKAALKQVKFSTSQKSFINGITSLTFENNVAPRYLAIQVVKQTTFKNIKPVATMESVDLTSEVLPDSGIYRGITTTVYVNDVKEHFNNKVTVNKDKTIDFVEYDTVEYTFTTLKLYPVKINGSNDYVIYSSNPDEVMADSYEVSNPTTGLKIQCLEATDWTNGLQYKITFEQGRILDLATNMIITDSSEVEVNAVSAYVGKKIVLNAVIDGNEYIDVTCDNADVKISRFVDYSTTFDITSEIAVKDATLTFKTAISNITKTVKVSFNEKPSTTYNILDTLIDTEFKFAETSGMEYVLTLQILDKNGHANILENDEAVLTNTDLLNYEENLDKNSVKLTYEHIIFEFSNTGMIVLDEDLTNDDPAGPYSFTYHGADVTQTNGTSVFPTPTPDPEPEKAKLPTYFIGKFEFVNGPFDITFTLNDTQSYYTTYEGDSEDLDWSITPDKKTLTLVNSTDTIVLKYINDETVEKITIVSFVMGDFDFAGAESIIHDKTAAVPDIKDIYGTYSYEDNEMNSLDITIGETITIYENNILLNETFKIISFDGKVLLIEAEGYTPRKELKFEYDSTTKELTIVKFNLGEYYFIGLSAKVNQQ